MILEIFNTHYSNYTDISIDAVVYLDLLLNKQTVLKKYKHIKSEDKLIIKSDITNMDAFLFKKIDNEFNQVFIQSIAKFDTGDILYPNAASLLLSLSLQCFKNEESLLANVKKLSLIGEIFKNSPLKLNDHTFDVFHFLMMPQDNNCFQNTYYEYTKKTNLFINEPSYSIEHMRSNHLKQLVELKLPLFSSVLYKLILLSASNPNQLEFFCNLYKNLSSSCFEFYFSFFLHNNNPLYEYKVLQGLYDKVSKQQEIEYSMLKFLAKHKHSYLNLNDFFTFLIKEDLIHIKLLLSNFKNIQSDLHEN